MATASLPEESAPNLRLRAGVLSLVIGSVIFLGKLLAWYLTGSTAVLSDALESIINVIAASLLLYSLIVAARPADRDHPYGHGKVEFFSAGVEGACIAGAAILIVIEAVRAILRGPRVENIDIGLVVLFVASVANLVLGLYLVRVGRKEHSLALVADGRHVLADVTTSAGVLVGLVAVRVTGLHVLDPLVAMAVAVNILVTGWRLVRQAVGGLMDEADLARLEPIVEALERARAPEWIDIHTLRSWRSGHLLHVDLHLTVPRYFDVERAHAIDEEIARALPRAAGVPCDVIVHFDPCRPRYCEACDVSDCPVRGNAFVARVPFSLERAIRLGPGRLEPLAGATGGASS
jgi:cation diffusion facilitator family transporter